MMMSNYDTAIDEAYVEGCTYPNKNGMFPTFDILEKYHTMHPTFLAVMPTASESEIISMLVDAGYSYPSITNYYKQVLGYRNCLLPLSVRYPNLSTISTRIHQIWLNHDIVNEEKFARLISTITDSLEISPLYNRHIKTSADDVTTPNLTDTTTTQGTKQNQSTLTDTYDSTDTHGGQDTTVTSGNDTTNTSTVNGVTSFDQSQNFVNNDNTTSNDHTTSSENETKSFGETLAHTGSDTHATNGRVTDNTTVTARKQGTSTYEHDGDRWESDLSLAQARVRESALTPILDLYFASVAHDISLFTLEEIW